MKGNGLNRLYDRLEPEERFRLDVLAMARGDEEESERLTRTCPRFSYTMNDRAFTGRWTGTYEITLRVYIALNNTMAKLQMIDAFRTLIPYSRTLTHNVAFDAYFAGHEAGSYHAWNSADMEGRPPAWPEPDMEPDEDERDPAMERDLDELEAKVQKYGEFLPKLMDRLERDLATEAFSVWEGFSGFCEEHMGLEAEDVLKVVAEPGVERVETLRALAERLQIEADSEIVETIREGLAESWRVVCERGV
jgi:hypothetical protein